MSDDINALLIVFVDCQTRKIKDHIGTVPMGQVIKAAKAGICYRVTMKKLRESKWCSWRACPKTTGRDDQNRMIPYRDDSECSNRIHLDFL